jgi:hypothetical protein
LSFSSEVPLSSVSLESNLQVQWLGTIAPNSVSNDLFIFYDFLPTVAELAGVARSAWPDTDGISAVPIFEATRPNMASKLAASTPTANRALYWESCHYGMVNGMLNQSYAAGWGQAVRFDDNGTAFETQWKAIAVNSNYTNILLYNISGDQSESVPLAGAPVGSDVTLQLDHPLRGESGSPVVAKALAYATELFRTYHVEDPHWKSSKNASDRCCGACFSPHGCPSNSCMQMGPPGPPPVPPAPPGAPIVVSALAGNWSMNGKTFTLSVDTSGPGAAAVVTIANPEDPSTCWSSCGSGGWEPETNTITDVICKGCNRNATGAVRARKVRKVVDHDYIYEGEVLDISWAVDHGSSTGPGSGGRWATWTKTVKRYEIVLEHSHSSARVPALPARIVVAADATETEAWAAAKLADLLKLPVVPDGGLLAPAAPQIAVGHGAATAIGVPAAVLDSLDDDSYLVSTSRGVPPGSVAIASSAHSTRGTAYGAFGFLRALGFEFFAENATQVPSPLPTSLPAMDARVSPSYTSRNLVMASPGIGTNLDRKHVSTGNCSAVAKAEGWRGGQCQGGNGSSWWRPGTNLSAALGLNGDFSFGPVGGYLSPHDPPGFVATAFNLLTPSLYADAADCAGPGTFEPHEQNTACPAVFRQHPSWFTCGQPAKPCTAVTINQTFSAQPCWSAPGLQETMTQNVLRILRSDPTIKIISVSNMDGGVSFSPCPLDMPAAKAENATGAANFYVIKHIAAGE